MRRAYVVVIVLAIVTFAFAALLFAPILEHSRRASPDGRFVVVVRAQPFLQFIPVMPGGGSDKPARATLYRDGKSCGAIALPMASFVYEMRWVLDATPRRADIGLAGSWDLDRCRVGAY